MPDEQSKLEAAIDRLEIQIKQLTKGINALVTDTQKLVDEIDSNKHHNENLPTNM